MCPTACLTQLSVPHSFDEVYYGQFVSLYMKRVFFIDESGPPFGHMILALGGELGLLSHVWWRRGDTPPSCHAHLMGFLAHKTPDLTNQLFSEMDWVFRGGQDTLGSPDPVLRTFKGLLCRISGGDL